MLLDLIHNIALLVALAVGLQTIAHRMDETRKAYGLAAGLLFGLIGVIGMMTPMRFAPGVIYDGRSIVLCLAGVFAGGIPALVAAVICAAYRLYLGGAGALVGVGVIVEAAALGVLLRALRGRDERWVGVWGLLGCGLLVHVLMLALQLLIPGGVGWMVVRQVGVPILAFYPLAFLLVSNVFLEGERRRSTVRALAQSEERFRQLATLAPVGIAVSDREQKCLYLSPKFVQLFGYSIEDIRTIEEWWLLAYPDAAMREQVRRRWTEAVEIARSSGGEVEPMVYPVRCRDGRVLQVEFRSTALEGVNIVVTSDITERKKTEEEALRSARRMKVVAEVLQFRAKTLQDFLDYALAKALELTQSKVGFIGFHNAENAEIVMGSWSPEVMANCGLDDPQTHFDVNQSGLLGEAIKQGRPILVNDFEADVPGKGGFPVGHIPLQRFLSAPILQEKQIVGIVGVGNKSSDYEGTDSFELSLLMDAVWKSVEALRSQEALRASQAHQEAMIDCSPVALYGIDLEGRVQFWNASAERIFGWTADEVLGRTLPIVPEERMEEFEELRQAVNQKGGFSGREVIRQRKDGSTFPGRLSTAAVRDSSGRIVGIMGAIEDVTESKRLEEQLGQSQRLESVGRLAGGVAHDFNNMLNVILGHADLLLDDLPEQSPWRPDLEEIRSAAKRSANLTRQLLAFARQQTIAPRPLDLNRTVASMLRMLERLIGENISLLWQPHPQSLIASMDPAQVDQILANLIVNARDAITHDQGKIIIETGVKTFDEDYCASNAGFQPGEYVMLAVSDNGCGFDQRTRDRIFEPFFSTKGAGQGTGLGLATVYGIVRQNQGFITVYSEPGEGSTFHIYLPSVASEIAEPTPRPAVPDAPHGAGATVLLVEDEEAILALGCKMLERLGYRVLAASTPTEALRLAEEHRGEILLLITDVVMPEMNGRELARRLHDCCPEIKKLFISGYTANVIAHQGVLEEGVQFLQKPFSIHDLSHKVREVLGES